MYGGTLTCLNQTGESYFPRFDRTRSCTCFFQAQSCGKILEDVWFFQAQTCGKILEDVGTKILEDVGIVARPQGRPQAGPRRSLSLPLVL